jgi:hypothetical protein
MKKPLRKAWKKRNTTMREEAAFLTLVALRFVEEAKIAPVSN